MKKMNILSYNNDLEIQWEYISDESVSKETP